MERSIIITLLGLITIIFWALPAAANDTLRLLKVDGPQHTQALSQHIDFYQDANWEKTIEDKNRNIY